MKQQLEATVMGQLSRLGLGVAEGHSKTKRLNAWGDASLSASVSRSDGVIEFGLTERQDYEVRNVIHCSLDLEGISLWVTSEDHSDLGGEFTAPECIYSRLTTIHTVMAELTQHE